MKKRAQILEKLELPFILGTVLLLIGTVVHHSIVWGTASAPW